MHNRQLLIFTSQVIILYRYKRFKLPISYFIASKAPGGAGMLTPSLILYL